MHRLVDDQRTLQNETIISCLVRQLSSRISPSLPHVSDSSLDPSVYHGHNSELGMILTAEIHLRPKLEYESMTRYS